MELEICIIYTLGNTVLSTPPALHFHVTLVSLLLAFIHLYYQRPKKKVKGLNLGKAVRIKGKADGG